MNAGGMEAEIRSTTKNWSFNSNLLYLICFSFHSAAHRISTGLNENVQV